MTYDEAIEKMAEAEWQQENIRCMGKPRLCKWMDTDPKERDKWRGLSHAAAEAIGLREMMEVGRLLIEELDGYSQAYAGPSPDTVELLDRAQRLFDGRHDGGKP